jgi:tetratricopeptide (TPR) repeat protein
MRLSLCLSRLSGQLLAGGLIFVFALAPVLAQNATDAVREAQRLARVAQVAEQQGRLDDAIRAYQTIAVVAKSSSTLSASAHVSAGNIYMKMGKFEEAIAAFRRALALNASSAEAQNNLGEALGELKQYPRSLEAFQRAVALDNRFVRARYNMGVTYDHMGQLKYAEFVYRILIRDYPDFVLAYDSLAVTLSKSGRAREAIPFHAKAVTMDPKEPSFYYNFAMSYVMLGDLKQAREQQQRLRNLDPAMAEHLATVIARH